MATMVQALIFYQTKTWNGVSTLSKGYVASNQTSQWEQWQKLNKSFKYSAYTHLNMQTCKFKSKKKREIKWSYLSPTSLQTILKEKEQLIDREV